MAQDNVEMVRVAYEVAYAERSVEGVRDRFADDFVWHSRPEWPGKAAYGVDEMPGLWADLDETFSEFELVPAAFEEVGDAYVLVTVRQGARLRGSENRVETTIWHLWRIDGTPREAWVFANRAEALEAARLAE
jgi:hypothetical protein